MARRRRSSLFEDLFDIASELPWWIGVVFAVVSYIGFHYLAIGEVAKPSKPSDVVGAMGGILAHTLAMFLQYILPIVFLLGAAASAIGRMKRKRLHAEVGAAESAQVLQRMNWQEFEALVGEAFRQKGFEVTETGGGGADGGVDLVLTTGRERYLVQCKQWRSTKVPVSTVRELYGVMQAQGAVGAFIVTSGMFTDDAAEFARGRNIELVEGETLFKLVRESSQRVQAASPALAMGPSPAASVPDCPQCGKSMVRRVAKKGAAAGSEFWGCSGFPGCRGTRPIAQ
jgi:restriction system protein